jgi:rhodanese-related sulfurtransferase
MPQYASIIEHANDARTRIREVEIFEIPSPGEKGTVYLDVREVDEFNSGHIQGALNLPRIEIEQKIAKIVPEQSTLIVVYCAVGHRSAIAADTLQDLGYTQVLSLKGGLLSLASNQTLPLVA